jgi:hypothetical protein
MIPSTRFKKDIFRYFGFLFFLIFLCILEVLRSRFTNTTISMYLQYDLELRLVLSTLVLARVLPVG